LKYLDLENLPAAPEAAKPQQWAGLRGAASSLLLATAQNISPKMALVITENTQQAERLLEEYEFFANENDIEQVTPVLHFPDWETLPYDSFSPHQDIISERLATLQQLPGLQRGTLILSVNTLLHLVPPKSYLAAYALELKVGEQRSLQELKAQLIVGGYHHVDTVYEHGEFAVRGSILDLFPMGTQEPLRIEFFDEEIESMRNFAVDTQISSQQLNSLKLLPAREFPLNDDSIAKFRKAFRENFAVDVRRCPLYEDVSKGISSAGLEYYLKLFFTSLETLFDYLPTDLQVYTYGDLNSGAEQFWREVRVRHDQLGVDPERPLLPPKEVFLPVEKLFEKLKKFPLIELLNQANQVTANNWVLDSQPMPDLAVEQRQLDPMSKLRQFLADNFDQHILLTCESAGRREVLLELLRDNRIDATSCINWRDFQEKLNLQPPQLYVTIAPLNHGLWLPAKKMAVIAENQLFVNHVAQTRRRREQQDNSDFVIKSLTELKEGSAVVHLDHGVGRYRGLENFSVEDQLTEFVVLEYAEGAKLYVPVANLHMITRYGGTDPENAPLHKLGSDQWQKAKRKAAEKVIDVAAELLDIHARRAAQQGKSFSIPQTDYQLFSNSFDFEETPDQLDTIKAVLADMANPRPMDRLVCGDVGFGKTEVAMRAAFIAVSNHKQVAILAPTTLLAQQHYESFRDRFADWPVSIRLLSRFVSSTKQQEALAELANGKADIVIGTHKLLQESIKYKDLGLLIIDEEHRFGVRQKDRLLSLRANVDVLTLTATPIPRTLNMAMSALRDLSIIATPPARRLSVLTFIREFNEPLIKEAIHRELLRGGQVFYLHNNVRTIEKTAESIRNLVPEARVVVGHGQLRESELERVMSDFYHKRSNVLVCSTIIETGIDIPNANTIIIDRADTFGLAQLHQLRGRVGRSHHQAYAYLLTPHPRSLTADAVKRLEAISSADTLGAGFTLASHDLEIRGAGELLGEEQSGHMQNIGFTLYSEMLEQTVALMKAGKVPKPDQALFVNTEINLRIPALLPEDYLGDIQTRLLLYKRLANAANHEELLELKVEMIDRFGLLPEPAQNLLAVTALKLRAQKLGIEKLEGATGGGRIRFCTNTLIDPLKLVELIQSEPANYSLKGANELVFRTPARDAAERIMLANALLDKLEQ
jgi:transcription-repair coupling factor (superfamily II helicase)